MLANTVLTAALRGQARRIRCLLAHGAPANAKGDGHPFFGGHTALELALLGGHTEVARLLAGAGASGTPPIDGVAQGGAGRRPADGASAFGAPNGTPATAGPSAAC
jgi:ankyrin repeat protein